MAEAKVPYDKLENSGDGAVFGSRIQVSSTNTDNIAEAIDKLEQGVSSPDFKTNRDFTGIPSSGDEQYILFGRGALPGTGFRWNENTDKVEYSNDGLIWTDLTSIGGSSTKVEPITVDSTILANKYYDLELLPSNPTNVRVFLVGGSVQFPTDDYELILDSGSLLKRVSWDTKGLDTVLTLGDKLIFAYETTEEISGISSGPIKLKVEALALNATDVNTNKYKDLSEVPLDPAQVALFIVGGTVQVYGTDYTVTIDGFGVARRISWATEALDGELVDGDVLVALYNVGSGAGGAIRSEHIEVDTTTFTNNLNGLVPPATLQEALEEIDQFAFSGGGSGGEITKVEYFTSDGVGTVGGNQYFDLATTPSDPATVRVTIVGGSMQLNSQLYPGTDYDVITDGVSIKRVSWNGLDMGAALTGAGIVVIVEYTINVTNPDQAVNVQTNTSGFNNILSVADTEVQAALDTLDNHTHPSSAITTTGFTGVLSGQGNVQSALNVIDSSVFGNTIHVTQANSFSSKDIIRHNGSNWVKAIGSTIESSTGCWMVISATASDFIAQQNGKATITGHGIGTGQLLYLSPTIAGAYTTVKPVGTPSLPLGFYLPVAFVDTADTIQLIGQQYPSFNPVLAEYVNDLGVDTNSVTFTNLDLNSYGGQLRFIAGMSQASVGGNSRVYLRVNNIVSAGYRSYSHYYTTVIESTNDLNSDAFQLALDTNSPQIGRPLTLRGVISKSSSTTAASRVSVQSFWETDGSGTHGRMTGYLADLLTNINTLQIGDIYSTAEYRFRANSGNYVRLLWDRY